MKPIYPPSGRAAQYAPLAINIYTGCNHGCEYCFAHKLHDRWHPDDAFDAVTVRPGLMKALEKQLSTGAYKGKTIHLCFMCDPYPAPPADTAPTREVIKALKAAGCHVQILTKGGQRAERDFDLLDGEDWFGVTISGNGFGSARVEPNAAPVSERVFSLQHAKDRGVNTWISCEPVYDVLAIYYALEHLSFVDLFRIGKLNYAPSAINWGAFGRECERLARRYGRSIYIKEELRAIMNANTPDALR